jgi:predicted HTH domain antitoxin
MEFTVELPNDLEKYPDPARAALEALVIAGYRSGRLTSFQAGKILGLDSRFEVDDFFKQRNVAEHAYSREDLEVDTATLRDLESHGQC